MSPKMLFAAVATCFSAMSGTLDAAPVRYGPSGWMVASRVDPFTGLRRCTLRSRGGHMLYQTGAIGFRVRDRDTLGALYRIDGGPALAWRDRYPALLAAGVRIGSGSLDAPTDGIIWLPAEDVRRVGSVLIRAHDRSPIRSFRPEGLAEGVAAAEALGCTISAELRG